MILLLCVFPSYLFGPNIMLLVRMLVVRESRLLFGTYPMDGLWWSKSWSFYRQDLMSSVSDKINITCIGMYHTLWFKKQTLNYLDTAYDSILEISMCVCVAFTTAAIIIMINQSNTIFDCLYKTYAAIIMLTQRWKEYSNFSLALN